MRQLPQKIREELEELSQLQRLLTWQRHGLSRIECKSLSATAALAEALMGIEKAQQEISWRRLLIQCGDIDVF